MPAGGLALLTEGRQAQHGHQQGIVPPAALLAGLPAVGQDVPAGGLVQIVHGGALLAARTGPAGAGEAGP